MCGYKCTLINLTKIKMLEERLNDGGEETVNAGSYTGFSENVRTISNEDKANHPEIFDGYKVGDVMTAELSEKIALEDRRRESSDRVEGESETKLAGAGEYTAPKEVGSGEDRPAKSKRKSKKA